MFRSEQRERCACEGELPCGLWAKPASGYEDAWMRSMTVGRSLLAIFSYSYDCAIRGSCPWPTGYAGSRSLFLPLLDLFGFLPCLIEAYEWKRQMEEPDTLTSDGFLKVRVPARSSIATRNGAAHITPILLIFPILLKGEETFAESGIEFADNEFADTPEFDKLPDATCRLNGQLPGVCDSFGADRAQGANDGHSCPSARRTLAYFEAST